MSKNIIQVGKLRYAYGFDRETARQLLADVGGVFNDKPSSFFKYIAGKQYDESEVISFVRNLSRHELYEQVMTNYGVANVARYISGDRRYESIYSANHYNPTQILFYAIVDTCWMYLDFAMLQLYEKYYERTIRHSVEGILTNRILNDVVEKYSTRGPIPIKTWWIYHDALRNPPNGAYLTSNEKRDIGIYMGVAANLSNVDLRKKYDCSDSTLARARKRGEKLAYDLKLPSLKEYFPKHRTKRERQRKTSK